MMRKQIENKAKNITKKAKVLLAVFSSPLASSVVGAAMEHWGRAEDKWNGDLWKIIDDNGIIYDSALDWTQD